jgi:hypothetical protein
MRLACDENSDRYACTALVVYERCEGVSLRPRRKSALRVQQASPLLFCANDLLVFCEAITAAHNKCDSAVEALRGVDGQR